MDDNLIAAGGAFVVILGVVLALGNKIISKLETIAHDIQQVKTAQRASQKRERILVDKVGKKWEK